MKPVTMPLLVVALVAMHASAAEGDARLTRQLRSADDTLDTLDTIVPDAMVLGSTRSKNRLVAVSTADDDAAVMTTVAKTTSRARDLDREQESLLGGGEAPTKGSSAQRTASTMVARSDATTDAATMTTASATQVRAEPPSA